MLEDDVSPRDRARFPDIPPLPRGCALFLDVDGTLVEFRDDPAAVRLPEDRRHLLRRVVQACDGALALVSGRTLESLDRIVAPLPLPAAGQHGLARRDFLGRRLRSDVELDALQGLRPTFERFCAGHPGAFVEDKGAGLALHYRRAPEAELEALALADELAANVPRELAVLRGKMVVEVKSSRVTKASAIAAFLGEDPFAGRIPVFFGDDTTDEDGFSLVNERGGISVKVGTGATSARHRVAAVDDVWMFLESMTRAPDSGSRADRRPE